MELRNYQIEIATEACDRLVRLGIVYLAMEVRTGKTLTALETAKLYGAKRALFTTKKKAISSIENDYKELGYQYELVVVNNESMHKVEGDFDLVISDEHHRVGGAFPKPNKVAKYMKDRFAGVPMIFLSGTPTPEGYSQIYHQFWVSSFTPFSKWSNFYKWAKDFVDIYQVDYGYGKTNRYERARGLKGTDRRRGARESRRIRQRSVRTFP
jgi:superfamily II DNA or RNA helicase